MMSFLFAMANTPTILYEDNDVLVLDKPAGLPVHGGDGLAGVATVVDWFVTHYPSAKGVGEPASQQDGTPIERSGVVHRLDRDTSGVMILAKHNDAHAFLKAQFKDRSVRKEYRALVYGHVRERFGTIDRPIGRSAKDWRLRSAQRGARGQLREAVTDWELIGQGEYGDDLFSYVKLKPKTGRMHQLRVHCKAINHPIVGDPLYAGELLVQSGNLGLSRLALHAHVLELTLPGGDRRRFIAPIPHPLEVAADLLHEESARY
jgi:23S rRNA pseudouridine1911/1915/1917 synthase